MAGVPKSLVKFNAREQLLSSDMNRAQWLASRDDQDGQGSWSRSFDSAAAAPASPNDLLSATGAPISGLDQVPTFAFSAGYTCTIGAGSGYLFDPTFATLSADDSPYLTLRWPQQDVAFANPHATLPRIDVVVATAAAADTDSQSRTVLVDPVTRAITTTNLFKTSNPLSTLSVVTGAAGANPAVPAIPADSIALFYVWVVQSAPDASTFGRCRASWRRAPHPFASMSGVVEGMGLKWDQTVNPSGASIGCIAKGFHRIVIDGEVLEFFANMDSTVGGFAVDSANNPFGAAAPATWHKPYYIYAVGGRHNPKPSFNTSDGFLSPVTIVESLTAPNVSTGKPSANMTVGGTTITPNGAVYIGLGFVYMNTTNRHACFMTEDMTYAGIGSGNFLSHTWGGIGNEAIGTLLNMPAISTKILAAATFVSTTAKLVVSVGPDRGDLAGPALTWGGSSSMLSMETGLGSTPFNAHGMGMIATFQGNGKLWGVNGGAADTATVWAIAFNHRVNRFGVNVNP